MAMITMFAGLLMMSAAGFGMLRHVRRDSRYRNHDTVVLLVALTAIGAVLTAVGTVLTVEPEQDMKTVLATVGVGVFITAIFGMWLNQRRYRIEQARHRLEDAKAALEQSRLRLDQEKVELEVAKDRREHDKAVGDVLVKAAELFGSDESLTRAATMHALATLAAQRPDRVQEVVDLLCLYLRCPPDDDQATREAQKVLSRVVARSGGAAGTAPALEIDLAGAHLRDLHLDGVRVLGLDLSSARLHGTTSLARLGTGTGSRCRVNLDQVAATGDVRLHDARLGSLSAAHAEFDGDLSMTGTKVQREVDLSDTTITGDASLNSADLGSLICGATTVTGRLSLRRARINGPARFVQARFGRADLELLTCHHRVVLDGAHFTEPPQLLGTDLPDVSLWHTTTGTPTSLLPLGWQLDTGPDQVRYLMRTTDGSSVDTGFSPAPAQPDRRAD